MNVKDRLTARNEAGQGIINMDGVSDALEASARIRTFSPLIISKLTEYEDTGLSPNEVNELKSENAALRERLEKAVELPCKIGDIMYQVFSKTQDNPIPFSVEKMRVIIQSDGMKIYVEEICGTGGIIGSTAFNRKSAEARLAELKGEKT